MDLEKLVRRLVVLLPHDQGAQMDLNVLREATGLPFEMLGSERHYVLFQSKGDLLRLCGFNAKGGFESSDSVEALLKMERRTMTGAQYKVLRRTLLPMMLAYAETAVPRTFSGVPFRAASPRHRASITRSMARARWGEVVTGPSVRVLHARMLAGDSQLQAAAAAGMSPTAASLVRRRLYDSWSDEIEAAWQATFGAQPVADPSKRPWSLHADKRQERDLTAARQLRQVYDLLCGDQPRTQVVAAKELGITRSQLTKVMRRDPSKWGPASALAWSETFGAAANGPRRPNFMY